MPPPVDEARLRGYLEDDWARDAPHGVMTPDRFCDSLFQIADKWTDSVDADEYVDLLTRLRLGS